MTDYQRLQLRASEIRSRLAELAKSDEPDNETRSEIETLRTEYVTNETRQSALMIAGDVPPDPIETRTEDHQVAELRSNTDFGRYLAASLAHTGVHGAELEYNEHLGLAADHFPLEMLTRDADDELETRALVDGDAGTNQSSWIERLFSDTAAAQLGVSMPSVAPGVTAYPLLGSTANPVQRGRTQASTDATITATVTEIKPTRSSVRATYSIEDNARLPGFADAIGRDLRGAMTEKIDRTIFIGDDGANETSADITGFDTMANLTELTLTQNHKVKADEVLKVLAGLIDGKYAASMADVNVVATVGSNQLWLGTIHNSAASNETIAGFLRANGVDWTTRGDIETATANGDFGAFVGLNRGIANTAVAPIWEGAQLITDQYTGAAKGEVSLTLNYLWGFDVPRKANYRRLKYVT